MFKKNLLAVAASFALVAPLSAAMTIQLQADLLSDSAGNPMPLSGLFLLVASINNTAFEGITAGALTAVSTTAANQSLFAGGDDYVVARGDLNSGLFEPGTLNRVLSLDPDNPGNNTDTFSLAGWETGDTLALFWFPTLTIGSVNIPAGTPFGSYTRATGVNATQPWTTPNDGISNYKLALYTTDGVTFSPGATAANSPAAGRSSQIVPVPEPSSMMLAGLGLALFAGRRRRN